MALRKGNSSRCRADAPGNIYGAVHRLPCWKHLPRLPQNNGAGFLCFRCCSQVFQKFVRQLIGDIQTPSICAKGQPFADDSMFPVDIVIVGRVTLVDVWQGIKIPPTVIVIGPGMEIVPGEIGGLLEW